MKTPLAQPRQPVLDQHRRHTLRLFGDGTEVGGGGGLRWLRARRVALLHRRRGSGLARAAAVSILPQSWRKSEGGKGDGKAEGHPALLGAGSLEG